MEIINNEQSEASLWLISGLLLLLLLSLCSTAAAAAAAVVDVFLGAQKALFTESDRTKDALRRRTTKNTPESDNGGNGKVNPAIKMLFMIHYGFKIM